MHCNVRTLNALRELSAVQAAAHRRIDAVEPGANLARTTDASYPAKRTVGSRIFDAAVSNEGAEAISGNAACNGTYAT